jgi:hypothetical protein
MEWNWNKYTENNHFSTEQGKNKGKSDVGMSPLQAISMGLAKATIS